MPVSLVRRPLILACLVVFFVAFLRPIRRFHLLSSSRDSTHYFNHTKNLIMPEIPGQVPFHRPGEGEQLSSSEPTCPPQPQCSPHPTPSNISTPSQSCNCPSISSSPTLGSPSSLHSQIPGKTTLEQETIAKLRAEGIVIIFKTGAQEVSQLAIHLGTTLRYLSPSDILFFSDLQGSIGPFIINDALRNVDQAIRDSNDDFEIYRKIHEYHSTGQDILGLTEDRSRGDGRGGWRLDKYKFIHMVEETFEMRPDARWYVFIETDSYIVWPNLVAWLSKLDSRKPWYMGSAVWTGAHSFAHGGSGYVLSNAAMNKLLGPDQPQGLARSWDTRMTAHCCGDIALGIALEEKGVKLTSARPFLNGYKPSTFTYGEHWCQPVVAMHHLTSHEISSMWRLERKRELLGNVNVTTFAELYEQFVEPHLMEERENWDNLSHGQEFKEPNGWSENSEQEELRREEEERLREERKKEIEESREKQEEEERQKHESEEREKQEAEEKENKRIEDGERIATNTEEPESGGEGGSGPQKDEGLENNEAEEKDNVKDEEHNHADEDVDRIEKPLIDLDSNKDSENVDDKSDLQIGDQEKGDENGSDNNDSDPKVEGDETREGENDNSSEDADEVKEQKTELKKLKAKKINNLKGKKKNASSIKVENNIDKHAEPAADVNVKDGSTSTEAKPQEQLEALKAYSEASPDPENASTSPKRLLKRQDSLADADPGLNAHEKWRSFSPEREAFKSFADCRKACAADTECFQFVHYDRTCKLSTSFRLGAYKAPELDVTDDRGEKRDIVFKSGWMVKRIRSWTERNACKAPEWPVINY